MRAFSSARRGARLLIVFSSSVRTLGAMRVLVVEDLSRSPEFSRAGLPGPPRPGSGTRPAG